MRLDYYTHEETRKDRMVKQEHELFKVGDKVTWSDNDPKTVARFQTSIEKQFGGQNIRLEVEEVLKSFDFEPPIAPRGDGQKDPSNRTPDNHPQILHLICQKCVGIQEGSVVIPTPLIIHGVKSFSGSFFTHI